MDTGGARCEWDLDDVQLDLVELDALEVRRMFVDETDQLGTWPVAERTTEDGDGHDVRLVCGDRRSDIRAVLRASHAGHQDGAGRSTGRPRPDDRHDSLGVP